MAATSWIYDIICPHWDPVQIISIAKDAKLMLITRLIDLWQ